MEDDVKINKLTYEFESENWSQVQHRMKQFFKLIYPLY
jgi:hypothetical protein